MCDGCQELCELDARPPATENDEPRGLGLLDPMPYRLTVNGVIRSRGTLQEMEAAVANIVTNRLALAPEYLAPEVQAIRGAFAEGDVREALNDGGTWSFTLDGRSDHPLRIQIGPEE
jgi:hypothetical protein